jgi:DNA polymerase I-like protein with 3'-5' exonuclease and polymerase domains
VIVHEHKVAGEPVQINVVEDEDDLLPFRNFIRGHLGFLGLDSETTGLDIYSDSFRCRVVQFGTPTEAWVIPVERGGRYAEDVRLALKGVKGFVLHNASFDLQVFEQTLGVPMEEMWPKVTDTRIFAHLVDPRGRMEGGIGHSLEDLVRHYIDEDVADSVKGLMNKLRLRHKTTKAHIWKTIEFDDPDYQLYSGMDPILATRLLQKLIPLVPSVSSRLISYEHRLAEICAYIERRGFLLDVEYTSGLSTRLDSERALHEASALAMGCENVNSTEQVADVIEARGIKIKARTPSGKRKVDKTLLEQLVAEGDEFAVAVESAKRAGKWRKTWVQKFLDSRDSASRCHAHINPLQARTARMSITGIPAQTLPSGDWQIRRCFTADPGQLMASIDYQAQELRVLAGLSGDPTMRRAFVNGEDLHQMTADASGVDRKIGKTVNFAYVYGSGPKNIADQCGISIPTAQNVIKGFESAYPGVKDLSVKLQREAKENGFIITPFGRRLPVDQIRAYSSLNYMIQSSSRDITAGALLRLHDQGFTPYVRLPIHDEVLASVPEAHAQWGADQIGQIMATEFEGVYIGTDPEVQGRSWGAGYMTPEEKAIYDA